MKIYVIGKPIKHSMSPIIHNYWLKKYSKSHVYEKKEVCKDSLKKIIEQIKTKKIVGVNVTIPYKKDFYNLLENLSSNAKKSKAVNTLYLKNDNVYGENTDGVGYCEALKQEMNYEVKGKNILVLGGLGYLGGRITKYICDLGHSVRVSTRKNSKDFPKNIPVNCEVIQVDYTKNFQLDEIMSGIDCVIDLVGPDSHTVYDDSNYFPTDQGADFFEFLGMELLPWLNKQYRLAPFNVVVGHDATAGFANYYLMKNPPLFQAYISLSPDLAPQMSDRLTTILTQTEQQIFYYQATSTEDIPSLREETLALHQALNGIENENFHYYFDDFQDATHYSLVGRAIPSALEKVFAVYRPISKKEFTEKILKVDAPYDYLIEKYDTMQNLFGLDDKIRINDFIAIAAALERKSDWDGFENLGKLASKESPETILGPYYLGRSYEGNGEPKKAMRTYEGALVLKEIGDINKDILVARAQQIKDDFGY